MILKFLDKSKAEKLFHFRFSRATISGFPGLSNDDMEKFGDTVILSHYCDNNGLFPKHTE